MAEYIAVIATVASVAGTVYSAVQSDRAGEAAEHAEERQAYYLGEQANRDRELREEQGRRLLSSQRAAVGRSGITTEGSPLLGMMETQALLEKDLAYRQKVAGWGISETLAEGESYAEAGEARAGTTLLTGLANTATSVQKYGQTYGWWKPTK